MDAKKCNADEALRLWEKKVQHELKSQDLSKLYKNSLENIPLKPLYLAESEPKPDTELPGFFPYKRGVRASMYTNKPWTIRQYAGFSSAKESNQFYKKCLEQGQRGLSVAFDLPTHRGYDSDDPRVFADVGMAGVAIDSILDMRELFSGIDLKQVSVSMTMNGAVLPILAAFIVVAKEQGLSLGEISGTIQNDILKEFMVRNTFIYPPDASMRIVADIMEYCSKHLPKFNSISISGYHIHEAGADLALELALTLANGLEYVKAALKRNIPIDKFAPRLSFFFATGMNFFMEIAKLRAARVLWAKKMRELNAQDEKSLLLRTHCQTSGWSLAAKDPLNNIVRTTIEAMASVLGGTQSLHTNSYDEAISLPTETSSRIARNTQLILQHETGLCNVVDPMAGSYYVESLTNSLIQRVEEIFRKIDNVGGMTKALALGLPTKWIEEAALKRQALIDSGQEVIVGVNKYQLSNEEEIEILQINNNELVKEQKTKLSHLRNNRDSKKVAKAIYDLQEGARQGENLLALSVDAMANKLTVGELSEALVEIFGRYQPPVSASVGVYKEMLEHHETLKEITALVESFAAKKGRQPRILVAKLGQDGHDRGAKIIASAFSDLGFDVDLSPLFQTPKSIAQQAVDNDVHVVGVSTLAAGHKDLVPALIKELKQLGAHDIMVVVGGVIPKQDFEKLFEVGVSDIFGPGTNVLQAAQKLLEKLLQGVG